MFRPLAPRLAAVRFSHPNCTTRLPLGAWHNGRWYSLKPEAAYTSKPLDIDPRKLVITKTSQPGALSKPENLVFGTKFTGTAFLA